MSYERRQYKLSEIGKIVTGKTPKTDIKAYWGLDYPFITPSDFIDTKYINLTSRAISEEGALSVKNNVIEANSVLVTCIGSDMGKSAISVKKSLTNQQINSITVDIEKFDIDFVYYSLSIKKDEIRRMASGSAVPILNKSNFSNIELSCPSLESQKKISNIANILDEKIELLKEENKILEAISQAIFKSWFIDFDPVYANQQGRQCENIDTETAKLFPDSFEDSDVGEIPKGWVVGVVGDIGDVICGKTPSTANEEYYGAEIPFITIPDMHNRLVITETNRFLTKMGADTQPKKYLPPGTICVSCIATAGLVAYVTRMSQTNQQINSVLPEKRWGATYPLFLLRRIGDAVRAGGSGGSVFHNLNTSDFKGLKVLLPDERIVNRFGDLTEGMLDKIIANQRLIESLYSMRDLLLPRLISGQLRINEAEPLMAGIQ